MILTTNAENLAELDIALAEMDAFQSGAATPRPTYEQQQRCAANLGNLEQLATAVGRLAMFDYDVTDPGNIYPTRWCKIRGHRYDKRLDHSTHNLWPFTGKLEPRLARACINLAIGPKPTATICDPFCGSGTVILEANLMGFSAVGFDLDPFAIWLSETKATTYQRMFDQRFDDLWPLELSPPPIPLQRDACPPTTAPVVLQEGDALELLRSSGSDFDAIVTSPPYYDAIDYNARHADARARVGIKAPTAISLGVGMTLGEYSEKVDAIAKAMANSIRPGGRIVIVAAPYHGVDSPVLYQQSLGEMGLQLRHRLVRPYRQPVLDVREDTILVMEKP